MKHISSINEFFGFSAKEKEEKQRNIDIENLKKELSKYNWLRMIAQPGKGDNADLLNLVKIRLYQGKEELPYLFKLVPQLFELVGSGTNAASCVFRLNNDESETYDGIVPSKFSFIVDPKTQIVSDNDENRERILNFILNRYIKK